MKKNAKIVLTVAGVATLWFAFLIFSANLLEIPPKVPVVLAASPTFSFNRDLKLGDQGEDVRELQKLLNKNPLTLIANSGPGAAGNETTYFGELTKWAVISFQEMYASEILTPNGLAVGTGFVGPSTRDKLNLLFVSGATGVVAVSPVPTPVPAPAPTPPPSSSSANSGTNLNPAAPKTVSTPKKISVYNTSKYQISPGSQIEINGDNFSATGNTFHIGNTLGDSRTIPSLPSSSTGKKISATIPADLPFGKYEIWVTVSGGSSRNSKAPIYIFVTGNPTAPPDISSITPASVTIDEEIIISGSGFTPTGNNIYSGLGDVFGKSSSGDGKIIKLKVSDFPAITKIPKNSITKGATLDVWIFIQNENGVNAAPGIFKIKL